jgi:hypothetical protein
VPLEGFVRQFLGTAVGDTKATVSLGRFLRSSADFMASRLVGWHSFLGIVIHQH